MRMSRFVVAFLPLAVIFVGCSALVDPDDASTSADGCLSCHLSEAALLKYTPAEEESSDGGGG